MSYTAIRLAIPGPGHDLLARPEREEATSADSTTAAVSTSAACWARARPPRTDWLAAFSIRPTRVPSASVPPPQRLAVRAVGGRFLRTYPFSEAYFLPEARRFRSALTMPLVLLGGITGRESMAEAMAAGFEFVAMARALLREPDLVDRLRRDSATRSLCTHCNRCMPTIYTGTRCPVAAEQEPPS